LIAGGGGYMYTPATLNYMSVIITLNLLKKKNGPEGSDRNRNKNLQK
jgi:hypothetical protein